MLVKPNSRSQALTKISDRELQEPWLFRRSHSNYLWAGPKDLASGPAPVLVHCGAEWSKSGLAPKAASKGSADLAVGQEVERLPALSPTGSLSRVQAGVFLL